jgi:hypothetical protein
MRSEVKQVERSMESNSRLKRAEPASFGAGLLVFGLGAMAAAYIADLSMFVVVAGALMHLCGSTTNTRSNAISDIRMPSG